MTIVDTTVWIDYLGGAANPHTEWLDRELSEQRLGLTDLILCEVLQGIRGDATFARIRQDMSKLEVFETRRGTRGGIRAELSFPASARLYGAEDH